MATGSSQGSPQDRDESPPLAMLPSRRRFGGGLPIPLSSLVGRAQTIADIRAMLLDEEIRLLTLTGSGGTGKTRLALAAAAALEASGSFEDGIVFIPLASVRAPDDVIPAIVTATGVPLSTDRPPVAVLAAALRDRHVLLVLDNFEQVAAAGAAIAALLIDCPRVSALVTSRERLRVGGERVFPVHPLDLPRPEDDPATLSQREAIRLFMVRAEGANPNQSLISEINVIGEICRKLDGLPLAIELASARATHLPPSELLARFERRLPLLTLGPTDAPARHRTMRDAIAWSHDLLTNEEQTLFRHLAVFAGGFSLDAAEAIAGAEVGVARAESASAYLSGPASQTILDRLASLLDKNLVSVESTVDRRLRYGLLETVREFAVEQLVQSGQEADVRERHARWFLNLAEARDTDSNAPTRGRSSTLLEVDWQNLEVALGWYETNGNPNDFLRLTAALALFWYLNGHTRAGRFWLERSLARSTDAPFRLRSKALALLAYIVVFQNEPVLAERYAAEALAFARLAGEAAQMCVSLTICGTIAMHHGDYPRAEQHLREALAVAPTIADARHAATATADELILLGEIAHNQDDLDLAADLHLQALTSYRDVGDTWGILDALAHLGGVSRDRGTPDEAIEWFRRCLDVAWLYGDLRVIAAALNGVACIAMEWGDHEPSARLFGAADALLERAAMSLVSPVDRAAIERGLASCRAALENERFSSA